METNTTARIEVGKTYRTTGTLRSRTESATYLVTAIRDYGERRDVIVARRLVKSRNRFSGTQLQVGRIGRTESWIEVPNPEDAQ